MEAQTPEREPTGRLLGCAGIQIVAHTPFWLKPVLLQSKLVLTSSDLRRVKVTRRDAASGPGARVGGGLLGGQPRPRLLAPRRRQDRSAGEDRLGVRRLQNATHFDFVLEIEDRIEDGEKGLGMSAQEIIAELPKLTAAELQRIRLEVEALARKQGQAGKTLSEALLEFAGVAKGLPADVAGSHDHYLHGVPKRGA